MGDIHDVSQILILDPGNNLNYSIGGTIFALRKAIAIYARKSDIA